jgi:hypothetical protein
MHVKYLQKMYVFLHMDSELHVWAGLYVQSKLIGILTFNTSRPRSVVILRDLSRRLSGWSISTSQFS